MRGSSNTVIAATARLRTWGGPSATRARSASTAEGSPMAPSDATAASRTARSGSSSAIAASHPIAAASPISPYAVAAASRTVGSGSDRAASMAASPLSAAEPSFSIAAALTEGSSSRVRSLRTGASRCACAVSRLAMANRLRYASSFLRNGVGSAMSCVRWYRVESTLAPYLARACARARVSWGAQ